MRISYIYEASKKAIAKATAKATAKKRKVGVKAVAGDDARTGDDAKTDDATSDDHAKIDNKIKSGDNANIGDGTVGTAKTRRTIAPSCTRSTAATTTPKKHAPSASTGTDLSTEKTTATAIDDDSVNSLVASASSAAKSDLLSVAGSPLSPRFVNADYQQAHSAVVAAKNDAASLSLSSSGYDHIEPPSFMF